jgi:hypothetical protein
MQFEGGQQEPISLVQLLRARKKNRGRALCKTPLLFQYANKQRHKQQKSGKASTAERRSARSSTAPQLVRVEGGGVPFPADVIYARIAYSTEYCLKKKIINDATKASAAFEMSPYAALLYGSAVRWKLD